MLAVPDKLPTAHRSAFHPVEGCDAIAALLGEHAQRPDYLLFTAYLWRAQPDPDAEEETDPDLRDMVIAPHEIIQACRGLKPTTPGSGKWLAEYCRAVDTTWRDWQRQDNATGREGRSRRVSVRFLEKHRQAVGRPRHDARDTFVHVVTRKPMSAYALPERIRFASEAQKIIAGYFDGLDPAVHDVKRDAFEYALTLSSGWQDDNAIQECVMGGPRYEAAASGKTERLDAGPWSNVRRAIRRAMLALVELDLQAAHLTIFERVCAVHKVKTPQLSKLLDTAGDIWFNACAACGLSGEHRDAMKNLALPAVFGAGEARLKELLEAMPESVLNSPLMRELSRAHTDLGTVALRNDGLKGPRGNRNRLKVKAEKDESGKPTDASEKAKKRALRSLIHSVCSDYEILLVLPIYETAKRLKGTGCYVALHQHDGVAIAGPEAALEAFISECQAAVAARAEQLGVRTRLIVKT